MGVQVECKECGRRLAIPDGLWEKRFAGRVQAIKCKGCGGRIHVDGRTEAQLAEAASSEAAVVHSQDTDASKTATKTAKPTETSAEPTQTPATAAAGPDASQRSATSDTKVADHGSRAESKTDQPKATKKPNGQKPKAETKPKAATEPKPKAATEPKPKAEPEAKKPTAQAKPTPKAEEPKAEARPQPDPKPKAAPSRAAGAGAVLPKPAVSAGAKSTRAQLPKPAVALPKPADKLRIPVAAQKSSPRAAPQPPLPNPEHKPNAANGSPPKAPTPKSTLAADSTLDSPRAANPAHEYGPDPSERVTSPDEPTVPGPSEASANPEPPGSAQHEAADDIEDQEKTTPDGEELESAAVAPPPPQRNATTGGFEAAPSFDDAEPDTLARSSWANGDDDEELEGPTTVMHKTEIAAALGPHTAPAASKGISLPAPEMLGRSTRKRNIAAVVALIVLLGIGLFAMLGSNKPAPLVTEESGPSANPIVVPKPVQHLSPAGAKTAAEHAERTAEDAAPSNTPAASGPGNSQGSSAGAVDPALETGLKQLVHYVEQCHKNGRMTGSGSLTLSIKPSGRVENAAVSEGPLAAAPVAKCIVARALGFTLPSFEGEAIRIERSFTLE